MSCSAPAARRRALVALVRVLGLPALHRACRTGYLLGVTQSKEYAEPEWYDGSVADFVWVVYFLVYVGTLARRREPHIYGPTGSISPSSSPSAMLHIINNLAIPVSRWARRATCSIPACRMP